MITTRDNNNKPHQIRDRKPFNDFLATNLDATINDRYCTHCHLKMVHNPRNTPYDRYIYSCPRCNCTTNIHNTEPSEKLVTMFPTHNAFNSLANKKQVTQPDNQRLSRSKYFINKRIEEKNKIEIQDPYLAILKQNNKIRITNVDYSEPIEEQEEYD
jgi:hypothetical protein